MPDILRSASDTSGTSVLASVDDDDDDKEEEEEEDKDETDDDDDDDIGGSYTLAVLPGTLYSKKQVHIFPLNVLRMGRGALTDQTMDLSNRVQLWPSTKRLKISLPF